MKNNAEKMRRLVGMLEVSPNGLPLSVVEKECKAGHFTLTELTYSFAIYEYIRKENGKTKLFIALCDFNKDNHRKFLET